MSIILETKNLCKNFKDQRVLDKVSIKVEEGKIYGLLGPNGAGKSTLLKLITQVISPTAGEIFFLGQLIKTKDLKKIGSIIEHPAIYPNLTAYENLEVISVLLNIDKNRIDEVLKLVSLENTGKKLVKNFSLGMKQRLGIAMALINNPILLILDEPTNGLDPLGIQELRTLIKSLADHGVTIIISSHILSEIQQVADTIGIINKGHLVYEGNNCESQMDLEELFLEMVKRDGNKND